MPVCSRLCGVPEQISASVPARVPDRLIKWFIGVVVTAVGVNLLSSFVVAQKWAWLLPAVFVAALLVAVPSTGLLRRERYGTTRARATALLALTGYLAVTVWGSVTGWPLALMILSVAYLWEAGVMLTWPTLRSRADFDHVAMGTACLLVGSAFFLLGVAVPNQIDEYEPISTSPITMELEARKQSWPIFGLLLLKDNTDMDILFTFINK